MIGKFIRDPSWLYVSYHGALGYVKASSVEFDRAADSASPNDPTSSTNLPTGVTGWDKPMTAIIDADGGLNMRVGPGSNYDKVMLIPDDSSIVVLGESSIDRAWWYVSYNGVMGFAHSEYIAY